MFQLPPVTLGQETKSLMRLKVNSATLNLSKYKWCKIQHLFIMTHLISDTILAIITNLKCYQRLYMLEKC